MTDTNTLVQFLANAYVTKVNCLGHHKSRANEIKVAEYSEKLRGLGVEVPKLDLFTDSPFKEHLLAIGQFNGDGAI